jgi:hypothetical protein
MRVLIRIHWTMISLYCDWSQTLRRQRSKLLSLDPEGLTSPGTTATVIGWGATSEGGGSSQDLLEVEVPIVSQETASAAYQPLGSTITKTCLQPAFPKEGKIHARAILAAHSSS